jgi:outer membrane biosynthesis protein TonB
MSSKSSAIGKGILIGAAAGVALYVIWRRSRETREVYEAPVAAPERREEPAPEPAPEAAFTPVTAEPEPVAEPEPGPEPVAEAEPEAAVEPEPLDEPEPVEEPKPVAHEDPEPAAEEPAAAVEAPPPPAAPIAEHYRRPPVTHTGRPRDLNPAGWPQPMPLAAPGGLRRPAPVSTRATWPGIAGAGQLRPTPGRRFGPRGGSGIHRSG